MVIHYEITGRELQRKNQSNGHFHDACLCGNGSFHARKTRHRMLVTCESCKERLARNPSYLESSNG